MPLAGVARCLLRLPARVLRHWPYSSSTNSTHEFRIWAFFSCRRYNMLIFHGRVKLWDPRWSLRTQSHRTGAPVPFDRVRCVAMKIPRAVLTKIGR